MKLINSNEKGIVFVATLVLIAVLSIMGTVAVITTNTDVQISSNYKTSARSFYATEAGIEEARARLRGQPTGSNANVDYAGDTGAIDDWWSAYILTSSSWNTSDDPNYSASYLNYYPTTGNPTNATLGTNTIQTTPDISYWVKIRHKREYDAEQAGHSIVTPHYYDNDGSTATHTAASPGNVIYWGFGDPALPATPVQFSTSAATTHKPVDIITAYGSSVGSSKTVEEEVVSNPGPPVISTIYSRNDININGAAGVYDGNDNCVPPQPSLPPIYTLQPSTTTFNGAPTVTPDPPGDVVGPIDIALQDYVDMLRNGATVITLGNGADITYWGSATDYQVFYSETSGFGGGKLSLSGITGFGVLLVEGDLDLNAGFSWSGLIVVTGACNASGGGGPNTVNVKGALLANPFNAANGHVKIRYYSCEIENALFTRPAIPISWKEIN
ncbi:MAG: PilX N-terminal domain-containing pilus assembly protein [Candidatus Scalinduaceae bacterium]